MQSRSGVIEDSRSGVEAPAGSREADLMNQIKLLREEITSAQETAAAATGHAKQYEMLAKSSDEAVKTMQVCPESLLSSCISGMLVRVSSHKVCAPM